MTKELSSESVYQHILVSQMPTSRSSGNNSVTASLRLTMAFLGRLVALSAVYLVLGTDKRLPVPGSVW